MARKVKVQDDYYTPLESYCIGLNTYYTALRKAGFSVDIALAMIQDDKVVAIGDFLESTGFCNDDGGRRVLAALNKNFPHVLLFVHLFSVEDNVA